MTNPVTREYILDLLKPMRGGRFDKLTSCVELRDIAGSFNNSLAQVTCANDVGTIRWFSIIATNSTMTRSEQALLWSFILICTTVWQLKAGDDFNPTGELFMVACDNLVKELLTEQMRNQTIF